MHKAINFRQSGKVRGDLMHYAEYRCRGLILVETGVHRDGVQRDIDVGVVQSVGARNRADVRLGIGISRACGEQLIADTCG